MIKGIIYGAASVIAMIASAQAADMYKGGGAGGYKDGPYVSSATWTGFYAGINGGYASSVHDDQYSYTGFAGIQPAGGFGGGQIGYNIHGAFGLPFVIGVEADLQGADISDEAFASYTYDSELEWFGTVRGRIGYAAGNALAYFTGGIAYGSLTGGARDGGEIYKYDDTATGYVLGGGVEYKFTSKLSLKAEYQYLNFGRNVPVLGGDDTLASAGSTVKDDAFHTVRLGLNYHVGSTYEPMK
ncbi:porin family protein [Rhodomicrobium vannielii ATCC 17100]|uniref:outer membrane protein n=1 Tax=Rhodomicrobium vannielii TaxID=1069 RepID=UPI0019186070|nr:outer membrane beta-barrel protein [Rhodomicrobium vannielii]MBJ7533154.1 porin family protein [Rhodomicrobium vannielii ATCC 17100]